MNTTEHLLTCLAEECTEIAKECCKSLRFGLEHRNVLEPEGPQNWERLADELNDLMALIDICMDEGILPRDWESHRKQQDKMNEVVKF